MKRVSSGISFPDKVLDQCARYGRTPHPILILGPPGIGKTTLARHVHEESGRSGTFVTCSMVGIPPNLEHAHLAGHIRGAFTGAHRDQPGAIEAAHKGTLFLDELGLASGSVQQILLQLLDEGTLIRVGESRARPVDVRIVAATNADLDAMAKRGEFRRDLLGRFGYLRIELPPLRARRAEIAGLVEYHLRSEALILGLSDPPRLTSALADCLRQCPWPDQIRQVKSVCRYIVTNWDGHSPCDVIDLPPGFLAEADFGVEDFSLGPRARALQVLERTGGNKTETAAILGMSRRHLYRLLAG